MNSRAGLAHMAAHTPAAFNTAFYATAATIIPVLFLALAVQGRMYGDLLTASRRALESFLTPGPRLRRFLAYPVWLLSVIIAAAIVAIATLGEIAALFALYQQSPVGIVLPAAIALVLLVVLPPAAVLMKFILVDSSVIIYDSWRRLGVSTAGASASPATTTGPASAEQAPGSSQPSPAPPASNSEEETPPNS